MKFLWGDGRVLLKTQAVEPIREVNLDTIERIVRQGGICYAVKIIESEPDAGCKTGKYQSEIEQLLIRYSSVV